MALSDEEKAKAYQEQVARAEAMKNDPSLRPESKPLVDVPSLTSIFGNPFADPTEEQEEEQGGFFSALDKATAGWKKQVERQKAVNRGDVPFEPPAFTFVSDEESTPEPPQEEEATTDDYRQAKVDALEAELKQLQIERLQAELEQLKGQQAGGEESGEGQ